MRKINPKVTVYIIAFLCFYTSVFAGNFDAPSYYNEVNAPKVYFFPPDKAFQDGYKVKIKDWKNLSKPLKIIYITEGIEEIKQQEDVEVIYDVEPDKLFGTIDKAIQILALGGAKHPVICILFNTLEIMGCIKRNNQIGKIIKDDILNQIKNPSDINVELNKTYIGYICCFKKDGEWISENDPPTVSSTKSRIIYSKYIISPSGIVSLSENYPLNYEYRITSIDEVIFFLDQSGLMAHYYEITFEPVKQIF